MTAKSLIQVILITQKYNAIRFLSVRVCISSHVSSYEDSWLNSWKQDLNEEFPLLVK